MGISLQQALGSIWDRQRLRACAQLVGIRWLRTRIPGPGAKVARELWAECWAAAFDGWPRCRADEPEAEEAWVFGIARRRLADCYRSGAIERRALERLRWTAPAFEAAEDDELARVAELALLRDTVGAALAWTPTLGSGVSATWL
jgi:DNA-directed RNA polymerase specialized sigma24 family protein